MNEPAPGLRKSHEPVFWALFGAGGMLAALVAPALILLTGILIPLGLIAPAALDYRQALALVRHPLGGFATFTIITLFLWHGAHRIVHGAHDLGCPARGLARWLGYGAAALGSFAAAVLLIAL